ncbi:hypothetical protein K474DRAFT_986168 [Panus rudis PR-1116 ss-1]|nr:hypothetical protein K474DRAFT_986168 [Panus rudis PR-1116 ss-1]
MVTSVAEVKAIIEEIRTLLRAIFTTIVQVIHTHTHDHPHNNDDPNPTLTHAGKSKNDILSDLLIALKPLVAEFHRLFPPLETAPSREKRDREVGEVLGKVESVVLDFAVRYGVERRSAALKMPLDALFSLVRRAVVSIGDAVELHPHLYQVIITKLVFGELFKLLQPSMLHVLGFRTAGLLKGSSAAWAQSLYRAGVPKGSVFSSLQRAIFTARRCPGWED